MTGVLTTASNGNGDDTTTARPRHRHGPRPRHRSPSPPSRRRPMPNGGAFSPARIILTDQRKAGVPFNDAWPVAIEAVPPDDRAILRATTEAWRAEYEGRRSWGGNLAAALTAVLDTPNGQRDDHRVLASPGEGRADDRAHPTTHTAVLWDGYEKPCSVWRSPGSWGHTRAHVSPRPPSAGRDSGRLSQPPRVLPAQAGARPTEASQFNATRQSLRGRRRTRPRTPAGPGPHAYVRHTGAAQVSRRRAGDPPQIPQRPRRLPQTVLAQG